MVGKIKGILKDIKATGSKHESNINDTPGVKAEKYGA